MAEFAFTPEAIAEAALPEATDGVYTLNEGHVAEGINHLITLFRSGPRNQAEMTAYLDQVQELEDMFWVLLSAFDVDTAVGDQLNLLGKIVGEPRLSRSDDDYRAAIRVRLLVNASEGKVEDLLEIAAALFPSPTYTMAIAVDEFEPASGAFYFTGDHGSVTLASVSRLLRLAKPAGVRLDTIFEDPEGEDGLHTDTVAEAAVDSDQGFGSVVDDTVGGVAGSVL